MTTKMINKMVKDHVVKEVYRRKQEGLEEIERCIKALNSVRDKVLMGEVNEIEVDLKLKGSYINIDEYIVSHKDELSVKVLTELFENGDIL